MGESQLSLLRHLVWRAARGKRSNLGELVKVRGDHVALVERVVHLRAQVTVGEGAEIGQHAGGGPAMEEWSSGPGDSLDNNDNHVARVFGRKLGRGLPEHSPKMGRASAVVQHSLAAVSDDERGWARLVGKCAAGVVHGVRLPQARVVSAGIGCSGEGERDGEWGGGDELFGAFGLAVNTPVQGAREPGMTLSTP